MSKPKVDKYIMHITERDKIDNSYRNSDEILKLCKSFRAFYLKVSHFPLDPRFNCALPAMDVFYVVRELIYSYASSIAAYKVYMKQYEKKDSDGHIARDMNYYISDALYRVFTVHEKLKFTYSAYLSYKDLEQSYAPSEFEKELKQASEFLPNSHPLKKPISDLLKMEGENYWTSLRKLRHQETHRLDPQIDVFEVKDSADWLYSKRITEDEAERIAREEDFGKGYNTEEKNEFDESYVDKSISEYKSMKQFEDGYYYIQLRPDGRLDTFSKVKPKIKKCLDDFIGKATQMYDSLILCPPFDEMEGNPLIRRSDSK